jgi:hypothetical protein
MDLETLTVISRNRFSHRITALSEVQGTAPLIVGTQRSVHVLDFRHQHSSQLSDRTEAPILEPILSMVYQPNSWIFHAAGSFPSILSFDYRYSPTPVNVIHSGSRLSSLAILPYSLPRLDRGCLRQGKYSAAYMDITKSIPGATLLAAGEYGTKGSLELYDINTKKGLREAEMVENGDLDIKIGPREPEFYRNRQTASYSKLLSVTNHGTRIVTSDGDGNVKWFERDGSTEVRNWNINNPVVSEGFEPDMQQQPLENFTGQLVTSILHTNAQNTSNSIRDDDLMLWTGERLGLLAFSSKPGFTMESFEEEAKSTEEARKDKEERDYERMMRVALERQADEVRFMSGLGLGTY